MYALTREDPRLYKTDWSSLSIVDPFFPCNITDVKMRNTYAINGVWTFCNIMVESYGEILMVRISTKRRRNQSIIFDVFRADMNKMEWVKVENIGDRSLFFSPYSSISICASATGAKMNSIYYLIGSDFFIGLETEFREYAEFGRGVRYVEVDLVSSNLTFHALPELFKRFHLHGLHHVCPSFCFNFRYF